MITLGPAHPPGSGCGSAVGGAEEPRWVGPQALAHRLRPRPRVPIWSGGGARATSPCAPLPPSRSPASGSWIPALAFPAPFEVSASDPGPKTSGRPSSEEATPEAVQTGAGDLGPPDLSGHAPSLGMQAGAGHMGALPSAVLLRSPC